MGASRRQQNLGFERDACTKPRSAERTRRACYFWREASEADALKRKTKENQRDVVEADKQTPRSHKPSQSTELICIFTISAMRFRH